MVVRRPPDRGSVLLVVAALTRHGASAPARADARPATPTVAIPLARPAGLRAGVPAPATSALAAGRRPRVGARPGPAPDLPAQGPRPHLGPRLARGGGRGGGGSGRPRAALEETQVIDLRETARVVNQ